MKEEENLKEKIIEHAKNYCSPHKFTEEEIEIIIKEDCSCSYCQTSIFELQDFPVVIKDEVLCEDCEMEAYYSICPLCEESYENIDTPKNYYIVVNKALAEEQEMKMGIYEVIKFPFHHGDIVFGFRGFFEENIKLLKEINIDEVFQKEYGRDADVAGEQICPECAKQYAK